MGLSVSALPAPVDPLNCAHTAPEARAATAEPRVQPRYPVPALCRPCPPQHLSNGRIFAQALDHVPAAGAQLVGSTDRQHVLNNWPLVARSRCRRCILPPKPLGKRLYGLFFNLAIPSALPASNLICKAQKLPASPPFARRRCDTCYTDKRGVP